MRDEASVEPARAKLGWIQALRFVAAAIVALGHCLIEARHLSGHDATALDITGFNWGYGVDIFFVISGFIMLLTTHNYFGVPGAPRQFLCRRIIRIVPIYWIMTLLLVLGGTLVPSLLNGQLQALDVIVTSLLFVPYPRPTGELAPVLAVGWSLNYEMFFYLVFALGMRMPLHKGRVVIAGCLLALTIAGALYPFESAVMKVWTDPLLVEFLMGMGIAWLYVSSSRPPPIVVGSVAAFGLVSSLAALTTLTGNLPRLMGCGVAAAALVYAAAFMQTTPATVAFRAITTLGDASYSLYLTHLFALRLARAGWYAAFGGILLPSLFVVAAFAFACVIAVLSYRLIEVPVTARLSRRPLPAPRR